MNRWMRSWSLGLAMAAALLAGALAAGGCRRAAPPVAELRVEPAGLTLAYPTFASLRLTFRPLVERAALGEQPIVFVHLLDEPGSVVRTFDHALPAGWEKGKDLTYDIRLYQSALAEPLPARSYILSVGLLGAQGRRCALDARGKEVDRGEYALAEVTVPSPGAGLPRFRFSDTWLPAEGGGNRQILARRWLGGPEGTLVAADLKGPGALWLELRIPGDGPQSRLELDAGMKEPAVRLQSNCVPEQALLAGSGNHRIDFEVAPSPPGPSECEIRFTTNYRVASDSSPQRTSVALENLAWSGP